MYKENFVVVIKCNGKVLRETNRCVRLPFGSQYSILLKNLDLRKAVAKISVDGSNVCDGDRIIVSPNASVELKGKMRGGKVRHKFKFIERTKEISNHRGNRPDDGLIRVEYWFEKRMYESIVWRLPTTPWETPSKSFDGDCVSDNSGGSRFTKSYSDSTIMYSNTVHNNTNNNKAYSMKTMSFSKKAPKTDVGITVQGSRARQDFVNGYIEPLENNSTIIVIQLKGKTSKDRKLEREITIKTRFRCPTCGRKSKSSAKWCSNCGTNLEV